MNRQEIYKRVKAHLLAQGCQSMSADGQFCRYRGQDGLMCAVGLLMADEAYDPSVECKPADHSRVVLALKESGLEVNEEEGDLKFLLDLQSVHDAYRPAQWSNELKMLAVSYGLRP